MASDRMVSGAYKSEYGDSDEITQCLNEVEVSLFLLFENLYQGSSPLVEQVFQTAYFARL